MFYLYINEIYNFSRNDKKNIEKSISYVLVKKLLINKMDKNIWVQLP